MLQLLLALLAAGFVIYLSYLASKFVSLSASRVNAAKYMKIEDRLPLGQDRSLVIVRIGEKHYLIGNAAESITALIELSDEDLLELEKEPSAAAVGVDSFKSTLQGILAKKKNEKKEM